MALIDRVIPDSLRCSIRLPRPLWIGLAGLMLAVVGFGLRIGVAVYRQHRAIAAIECAGGSVLTDASWPYGLRERVGENWMQAIESVDFVHYWRDETTDDDVQLIQSLPSVRRIEIRASAITDIGIAHLRDLTNLQDLDICGTKVTDAGLANLAELKKLQRLNLGGTKVSNEGLVQLHGMTNLRSINLNGTRVTASGIAELRRALPRLQIHK